MSSLEDEVLNQAIPTVAGSEGHAELVRLEALRRVAAADVWIARGERLPALTWTVGRGFDADSLKPSVVQQHGGRLATVAVSFPLFDWGAAASRMAQARLRVRARRRRDQSLL